MQISTSIFISAWEFVLAIPGIVVGGLTIYIFGKFIYDFVNYIKDPST